jgi:3-oxoacyl-[acyl-carrier protein] reductase
MRLERHKHAELAPEVVERHVAGVPVGHIGSPEDVAHAVSFFTSEGASFVTGQRLVVDGGRGVL